MTVPHECKHYGVLFIGSESGTRASGEPLPRKSAYICPHCGMFIVWINRERMTFWLVSDKQVAAAGVYAQRLRMAEEEQL